MHERVHFLQDTSTVNTSASNLFTGGFASIGKLPALFGWYIGYDIGIKVGLTNAAQIAYKAPILGVYSPLFYISTT